LHEEIEHEAWFSELLGGALRSLPPLWSRVRAKLALSIEVLAPLIAQLTTRADDHTKAGREINSSLRL
jgi:hypothetical protein